MSNPNIRQVGHLTRFKKGQSGNYAGRPKGIPNLRTVLTKYLETSLTRETLLGEKKLPLVDLIALRLIQNAVNGDVKSIKEIFDRVNGRTNLLENEINQAESKPQIIGFKFDLIDSDSLKSS